MEKFNISNIAGVRSFYQNNGFCLLSGLDHESLTGLFQQQLENLVKIKSGIVLPNHKASNKKILTDLLLKLYKHSRGDYVHILDTSHSLPALFGLCANPLMLDVLTVLKLSSPSVRMMPRVRIDFPGDDEFLHSDLQDCHGTEGSDNAVVCWITISRDPHDNVCIRVRPRSHLAGKIPCKEIAVRPYLVLNKGSWQEQYPEEDVSLSAGDMFICHMHTIHSLVPVKGQYPRISLQLRYNDFNDREYLRKGWPLTYCLVSRKDKILLRTYSVG